MRPRLTAVFALTLALTASGGAAVAATPTTPSAPSAPSSPASKAPPTLSDPRPCEGQPGFTCSMLTVPLDHRGKRKGELELQVATADNADAPKGTLLFLTGGPGQPGVPFITRISQRLPEVAKNYRIVMIDQRGTGDFGAINCPQLQAQVGSSDIEPPTVAAIEECAGILGDRRHYFTSEQTTGDLEMLRRALGVRTWAVDGVSYGSLTAARYAVAHPRNVSKLVLDSVLPHVDPQGDDMLYLTGLRATARVLREACTVAPACGFDPAKDLAWLARHRKDHVMIFDLIVTYEFLDPTYRNPNPAGLPAGSGDVIGAIHEARNGNPARLDQQLALLNSGGDPVNRYSSGLHIATVCGDGRFPWGTSEAPVAGRQAILERTRRTLPTRKVWPFTADTAVGNGFIQECLYWPRSQHTAEPSVRLPNVPTLILNGDRDLSTPLEWAREELRYAPGGKLVVVKGATHSIQNRELGTQGRDAVNAFLNG
ncbi:alpha/beta fold hydrolase [Actinomadura rudentiformis]|uniref:prolyl aminopeptidase n=1 Tax=Actinomadura rudentiformis TaxID=359158 RepID=A0A6H9YZ12_9ACTN|nr:alpha/beta fold hydrolase [Actinomadura rudentiformis]KAB2352624.1 alpha/beta fold hydrolase [Actinomadura rudentiformis]